MKIAALLTCHNRREKTLVCLRSLFAANKNSDVYLTDDGCTDGTAQAVKAECPNVHIVEGDGTLFWSRGMYTAWKAAIKGDYDYYLWLNDDIRLYPFFLEELFKSYKDAKSSPCIVSGLIGDSNNTQKVIYGGSNDKKRLLGETGEPQDITYMNGNVVLVPRDVVKKIGIIDSVFHHDLGDVDYGLTAKENNIRVVTTTRIIALGYSNNYCRVRKWGTTLKARFQKLNTPLGSPIKLNFYFRKKHFGLFKALAYCAFLIVLNVFPDSTVRCIWGDTYMDK